MMHTYNYKHVSMDIIIGKTIYLIGQEQLNWIGGPGGKVVLSLVGLQPICCYELHNGVFGHHLF